MSGVGVEPSDSRIREAEARDPRDKCEQHALDEQLPDDAPSSRADRDAHGHLTRAVGRAREQQIGDVRARDEEHEADGAHERPEQHAYLPCR